MQLTEINYTSTPFS